MTKAFVTSIGEPTTDLCVWSLQRNGFDVELISGETSLAEKLKIIYDKADDSFIRVDADVVVNKRLTPVFLRSLRDSSSWTWWTQFQCFDWLQQHVAYGGVQYIQKAALLTLRGHVDEVQQEDRPETALSRVDEFYNPRRFASDNSVVGLHGFALGDHFERVRAQKELRSKYLNFYDFEMVEKLEGLLR